LPRLGLPECCFGVKASTWTLTVEVSAPEDDHSSRSHDAGSFAGVAAPPSWLCGDQYAGVLRITIKLTIFPSRMEK
jgi:hypothetical protein